MIKHQFFVNEHLPVQTQREGNTSKTYSICSNLIIKILQQCRWRNYSVIIITFRRGISLHLVVLLFILLAKSYKKQRFKAQHPTLSNNFLGFLQNLQLSCFWKTSRDGDFKRTNNIFLKSVVLKGWKILDEKWQKMTKNGGIGAGRFIL